MKNHTLHILGAIGSVVAALAQQAIAAEPKIKAPTNAPFSYVWSTAYHVLPETTSEESGYFSLCEGLDGSIYVGTAKYGVNSYLVEFDPDRFTQKIVLDTHKVCGLTATGYAAQAKLHTRNFVAPSGNIYVGSKQGYRLGTNDLSKYPGGYVMRYDPRTGRAENLGMPFPEQGVIDVVADESRGLLYAVTCEDQHWMIGNGLTNTSWRELGPVLTPYATTLIDSQGRAHAITRDFEMATYDPHKNKITIRSISVGKEKFTHASGGSIPTWNLAPDGHTAYLILMNDPTLIALDLAGTGKIKATQCGLMIKGRNPDSRSALSIGQDGRVWALVRVNNETKFGGGYLHRLLRYDPKTRTMDDLGVLAVKNPDYYDFKAKKHHSHGFHNLPDGTLAPLHAHMGLLVAADNTLYVTILYPFTLLKIDAYRQIPPPEQANAPSAQVLDAVLGICDAAEKQADLASRVGTTIAERHLKGGAIGMWWENGCFGPELYGRAGNLVNIGFDRLWKKERSDAEKANDVALIGMDWPPWQTARNLIEKQNARKIFTVGFGPKSHADLLPLVNTCSAFFDSGLGADDRAAKLGGSLRAGHLNQVANALHGWMVMAETTAAMTRNGRMPAMWKSFSYPDGREWGNRYLRKTQFHDEFKVPPQAAGTLAKNYIARIRYLVRRIKRQELAHIRKAGELIAREHAAGRKTVVAWDGHMPEAYVGRMEDSAWAQRSALHLFLDGERRHFRTATDQGALVLRLGYQGLNPEGPPLFSEKKIRLICMAGEPPDQDWQMPRDSLVNIDMAWAFGDGCVTIEGYPFPLFAPSGIIQATTYAAICAEVAARIPPEKDPAAL